MAKTKEWGKPVERRGVSLPPGAVITAMFVCLFCDSVFHTLPPLTEINYGLGLGDAHFGVWLIIPIWV